jgi:quercetin dioxygenase-like cupin family protein
VGGESGVVTGHWNEGIDGPLTEAALGRKLASMGYRVDVYVYPPGTRFPPHTHGVDKIDAVFSGRFRISLGGTSTDLLPGDWVEVPAGAEHTAEVVGDSPVVSLDAVKAR